MTMLPMRAVCIAVSIAVIHAIRSEDLYPFIIDSNQQLIANDDASSRLISLHPPLNFYGRTYDECRVHNNGIIGFSNYTEGFLEDPFPLGNYVLIAPFYGDVDTRTSGRVWYTDPITQDIDLLERAKTDIHGAFSEHLDFTPTYLLISTWDHVGYFKENDDKLNTFQCVIATNGIMSFAIFLYNETQWTSPSNQMSTSKQAKVGFNDGYQMKFWEMPCSRSENVSYISYTSNIGDPGVWIFRIDQEIIAPACPQRAMTRCEQDKLCSCLTRDFQQNCQCTNTGYNARIAMCTDEDSPEIGFGLPNDPTENNKSLSSSTVPAIITVATVVVLIIIIVVIIGTALSFRKYIGKASERYPTGNATFENKKSGPIQTSSNEYYRTFKQGELPKEAYELITPTVKGQNSSLIDGTAIKTTDNEAYGAVTEQIREPEAVYELIDGCPSKQLAKSGNQENMCERPSFPPRQKHLPIPLPMSGTPEEEGMYETM